MSDRSNQDAAKDLASHRSLEGPPGPSTELVLHSSLQRAPLSPHPSIEGPPGPSTERVLHVTTQATSQLADEERLVFIIQDCSTSLVAIGADSPSPIQVIKPAGEQLAAFSYAFCRHTEEESPKNVVRALSSFEQTSIAEQTRNIATLNLDQAIKYVQQPLLIQFMTEKFFASKAREGFSARVTGVMVKQETKGISIYVPLDDCITECLRTKGIHRWQLGSNLALSTSEISDDLVIMMMRIVDTSVEAGRYVKLASSPESEDLFRLCLAKMTSEEFAKIEFTVGPSEDHSDCRALVNGFAEFFTKRRDLFDALLGRSVFNVGINIPENNVPFVMNGNKLDSSQLSAMRTAAYVEGVTTVSAPPGSGKTFLISALVQTLLSKHEDYRICISSVTNYAVDNAVESILSSKIERVKTVRQFSRTAKWSSHISDGLRNTSIESLLMKPDIMSSLVVNQKFAEAIQSRSTIVKSKDVSLHAAMKTRKAADILDSLISSLFLKYYAPEVFGTTASILSRTRNEKIDHLVLDECSQLSSWTAMILYCSLPNLKRITLIGDSKQLAPFSFVRYGMVGERSIVSEIERVVSLKSGPNRKLKFIYRAHPKMVERLWVPLYGTGIKCGSEEKDKNMAKELRLPSTIEGDPCLFIHVDGEEKNGVNEKEAQYAYLFIEQCLINGVHQEDLAVLCHHRAQKNRMAALLKGKGRIGPLKLPCLLETVDSFQGKEAKVTVVLFTTTCKSELPSVIERKFSFVSNSNRETVVLTRGQHASYFIGDWQTIGSLDFWKPFRNVLIKNKNVVNVKFAPFSDTIWQKNKDAVTQKKKEKHEKHKAKQAEYLLKNSN